MTFEEYWNAVECYNCNYDTAVMLWQAATLAEREVCAKICEEMGAMEALEGEEFGSAAMVRVADRQADLCAAAIRARNK